MPVAAAPAHTDFEALVTAPRPAGQVRGGLTERLKDRYAGDLWLPLRADRPTVIAIFVTTLDGVVSFQAPDAMGGGEISGFFEPDRFVMGLLRTLADAVLIGAGTLRAAPNHRWIPEHVNKRSGPDFAAVRERLGLAPLPLTAVLTASGDIDLGHPGLSDQRIPVLIVTTDTGAAAVRRQAARENVTILSLGAEAPSPKAVVELLARRGAEVVLSEGGPHLTSQLLAGGLLDELFLTVAPQIAGRSPDMHRLALVEGHGYSVADAPWFDLLDLRRNGNHLFTRYRIRGADGALRRVAAA